MTRRRVLHSLFCSSLSPAASRRPPASAQDPQRDALGVAKVWEAEHVDYGPPQLLDHGRLLVYLDEAIKRGDGLFKMEQIGQSVEGRSINHVWFGDGPMHVLLWSQMHGDEPTATAALLDILRARSAATRRDPCSRPLLRALTIHFVPMLNPDGAAAVPATQRPGDRRQPRRAPAPGARRPRAQGAARPAEAGARLQPAQPELADVGRQDEAGVDLAPGRRLRRGTDRNARPHAGEEDVRDHSRHGRDVRAGAGRAVRRRVRGARVRRQRDEVGDAGRAHRDRALPGRPRRPDLSKTELRRHPDRARRAGDRAAPRPPTRPATNRCR